MKKNITEKGTTLVEITVATMLFVSIVGLVTLSLAAVFEGYSFMQKRSSIEQDGQYILARMRYSSSQQDLQIVSAQFGALEMTQEGSQLNHVISTSQEAGGVTLADGFLSGEYTSPVFNIDDAVGAGLFIANVSRPAGTTISYQVAVAKPVDSSCANAVFTFVGEGGVVGEKFTSDYFQIPRDTNGAGFENPAGCLRYKIFMTTSGTQKPLIYGITIKK